MTTSQAQSASRMFELVVKPYLTAIEPYLIVTACSQINDFKTSVTIDYIEFVNSHFRLEQRAEQEAQRFTG